MSKYKKLAENTVVFALGNVLSKLILSLLLPLYTRVLTTAEYGTAELITSYSQLIIPLISMSIGDALFRFSMDKNQDSRTVLTNSYIVLGAGTTFLLILVPFLKYISSIGKWSIYLALICIFSMWRSAFSLYSKAVGKSKIFALDNILYNLFLALSNIILLTVFHFGIQGYFLSQIIANVLSIIFLMYANKLFYIKFSNCVSGKLIKMMLIYSIPLIFNSISWGVMSTADRIMLKSMISESANGIYAAAAKIPSLLSLITGVFTQAWSLSVIQDYEEEKDNKFYENVFKITHMGVVFGTLLMLLCNNWLFSWILGEDFAESVKYVPCLLIGTVFLTYSNYFSPLFSAVKNTKIIMISGLVASIINVILNYVLISSVGIIGACFATSISYAVTVIIRYFASKHFFRIKYGAWKIVVSEGLLIFNAILTTTTNRLSIAVCLLSIIVVISLYYKEIILVIRRVLH